MFNAGLCYGGSVRHQTKHTYESEQRCRHQRASSDTKRHGSQAELREPTTSCELFVRACCIAVASSAADEAAKLQSAMLAYTHFSEECSSKQDALL